MISTHQEFSITLLSELITAYLPSYFPCFTKINHSKIKKHTCIHFTCKCCTHWTYHRHIILYAYGKYKPSHEHETYAECLEADRFWSNALSPGTYRYEDILELSVVYSVQVIVRSVRIVLLKHISWFLSRSPVNRGLIFLL